MLRLAGRDWFVLHTPGHTEDHICLHDPEMGIFLGGDHVLPSITPHISGISSSRDPLASFFYSLDRVAEINGIKHALPAHGHPFTDLRARTEAIKRHHYERLDKIRAISRELGPASVEDISEAAVPAAQLGPDGRERDLRAPRAPAPGRPGGEPARGREADLRRSLSAPREGDLLGQRRRARRQRAPVLRGDARRAGRSSACELSLAEFAELSLRDGRERLRPRGGARRVARADRGRARAAQPALRRTARGHRADPGRARGARGAARPGADGGGHELAPRPLRASSTRAPARARSSSSCSPARTSPATSPIPQPYLMAAARLGVGPADCLVIEDSERGLQSAVAAGMRCAVVPSAAQPGRRTSRRPAACWATCARCRRCSRSCRAAAGSSSIAGRRRLAVPYAEAVPGFVLHDADSHVMETAEFFRDFADPDVRARMKPLRDRRGAAGRDELHRRAAREAPRSRVPRARRGASS